MRKLSVDCSAVTLVLFASIVDATSSFPALPHTSNTVFWSDAAVPFSDGGTDEAESSSDDDWSDWLTGTESPSKKQQATVTTSTPVSAAVTIDATHNKVSTETATTINKPEIEYQSQPLKTLEKLQQMLDDTDYMTAAKSKTLLASAQAPSLTESVLSLRRIDEPKTKTQQYERNDAFIVTPATAEAFAKRSQTAQASMEAAQKEEPKPGEQSITLPDQLWQSKDRRRYKRQQLLLRRSLLIAQEQAATAKQTVPRPPYQSPPAHVASSDGEESDDTDDGLSFSLPNLPVYYSDAEVDSEEQEQEPSNVAVDDSRPSEPPASAYQPLPTTQTSPTPNQYYYPHVPQPRSVDYQTPLYNAYPPQQHVPPAGYSQQPPPPPPHEAYRQYSQQPPPQYHPSYPYPPGYPYPYPPFTPHAMAQHPAYAVPPQGQYAPWSGPNHQPPRIAEPHAQVKSPATNVPVREEASLGKQVKPPQQPVVINKVKEASMELVPAHQQFLPAVPQAITTLYQQPPVMSLQMHSTEKSQSLAEASAQLSFDSIFKISILMVTVAVACYSGVSPRTLPLSEYNMRFYDNLRLVSLTAIAPLLAVLSVFDARENDVNTWASTFFSSFTFGYAITFLAEIVTTTVVRLGVFCWLEPNLFSFTPRIPLPVLPWVLKDIGYRPKRITLFAADVATTCIAAPIVEEYVKLKLLEWSTTLPRNFKWTVRESKKSKKKRKHAEAIVRGPGEKDVINANKYVSQMLAVSLGLKLCDTARRVLMYTKSHNENKSFYAFCRGIFPIHELCGTMTALALAKRDLLGVEYKTWQLLAPAVAVHATANFRGMKPFFKWNSKTPWSEMQLSPVNVVDPSTLFQLLKKGYAKLMWLVILSRVLGYCIKNYYMVNRQALKRTTTYAGKHAAFSAELATTEVLRRQKQK
ncbi:hypothetical protein MPSEU_000093600 [Mayamaea pseudoterrestris]|nr:hypothetical protein MPSEU_000093600 [Mayamaea pseudoterrestris]